MAAGVKPHPVRDESCRFPPSKILRTFVHQAVTKAHYYPQLLQSHIDKPLLIASISLLLQTFNINDHSFKREKWLTGNARKQRTWPCA
jgi:hypothetical protein